jgi:hypothetical protein
MELIQEYVKTQKENRVHPWLDLFLKDKKLPLYQQNLLKHLKENPSDGYRLQMGRRPYGMISRQSGKSDAQFAYIEEIIDNPSRYPSPPEFRISPELQRELAISDQLARRRANITRQMSEAIERRLHETIMSTNLSADNLAFKKEFNC